MPSEEHYDDSAFNYFAMSVLVIILVPSTFAYIKIWKEATSDKYTGKCGCDACRKKSADLKKQSRIPSRFGIFKFVLYLLVIFLFLFLLRKSVTEHTPSASTAFDPYTLLELDHGASPEEIKKAYRKLSLKYHPDKNSDPDAQEKFIEVAKAHKVLTDDDTREKWEKYGNPDGPQAFSVGIALPSFLVNTKNSMSVLLLYVGFLMIVIPTVVICWWSKQKDLVHNSLNRKTMGLFYTNVTEHMRFKKLITIMTLSYEYVTTTKLRRSDEVILKKLTPLIPETEKQKAEKKSKPNRRSIPPFAIKNSMLFYAYFSRLTNMLDANLKADLSILLSKIHLIVGGMVELTAAGRRWLVPTMESIYISQMVTQAVWSEQTKMQKNTALLQLPHFTEDTIIKLQHKKYKIFSIDQFLSMDPKLKLEFLKAEGFNAAQIDDIENISKRLPSDVTFKVKSTVDDEDESLGITGGSLVTLEISFTRPSIPGGVVEDEKVKEIPDSEKIDVHCPYYPLVKKEYWWLFLGDNANNLIGIKKVVILKDGTSVKLAFQAPRKAGSYVYTLHLMCDSYVGFDQKELVKIKVDKELKIEKPPKHEDDEDFDDDEELNQSEDDLSDDEDKKKITKDESDSDSDSD